MPTEGNHPYLKYQVLKNKLWVTELLEKLQMGKRGAPRDSLWIRTLNPWKTSGITLGRGGEGTHRS